MSLIEFMKNDVVTYPVYVLHVKQGYDERALHMEKMLKHQGMEFEYVLDGDIPDLTYKVLTRYFTGAMRTAGAEASCALKHIIAYERLIKSGNEGALILEDDIVLYNNFTKRLKLLLDECAELSISDYLLSLEESNLMYVPRSRRVKGIHIYKAERDRFTGCYYITRGASLMILERIRRYPMDRPIDRFHTLLISEVGFPYFWSMPALATQGSHSGYFTSSISNRRAASQLRLRLTWQLKRWYKKLLYWLR